MERTFFFLGFCLPSIQAVWRGFNSDSVLRKLFSGDMDFRKTETNLFFAFCPRGGGVWGGIRAGRGNEPRRGPGFIDSPNIGVADGATVGQPVSLGGKRDGADWCRLVRFIALRFYYHPLDLSASCGILQQ